MEKGNKQTARNLVESVRILFLSIIQSTLQITQPKEYFL